MSLLIGFLVMVAALSVLVACAGGRSREVHRSAVRTARMQFGVLAPRLPPAVLLGVSLGHLLPEAWVAALLGPDSGLVGIGIAVLVGLVLPGGPMVSLPLAMALAAAGAGPATLVTLITAWALLAVNRIMLFEAPVLGWRFALHRLTVGLPLPLLAGALTGLWTGGG